ncbi:class I SAM-dependent methyltransferase [Candidatus Uhrbacteria bacterium]|nr:class I SAM-dependent methyltransferase [Candidatus Uhrbacteria bacterium]
MMEQRKQIEIAHYESHAKEWLSQHGPATTTASDFEGFPPSVLSSYQKCYELATRYGKGKDVLDFGCGNGVHVPTLASVAQSVVGIDLSESSLDIACRRIANLSDREKIQLKKMDCENLEFSDNTFDLVFDGGVFSSLDFDRALSEIARVLKPDGVLIGIETFGHNPLMNLKRKLNEKSGKRTTWAASHILTTASLKKARQYFANVEVNYFHLLSWIALPFIGKPGGIALLRVLEAIEAALLTIPFLKKYAFKIVFVCSQPIKQLPQT